MSDEARHAASERAPTERRRSEADDGPWFDDGFVAFESETEEVPWDRPADEGWFDPEEGLLADGFEDEGEGSASDAETSPAYPAPRSAPYAATRTSELVDDAEAAIALDPYDEFAPVIDDVGEKVGSPANQRRRADALSVSGDVFAPPTTARAAPAENRFDPPPWASIGEVSSPWAARRASPGQLELSSAAGRSEDASEFAAPNERPGDGDRPSRASTLFWTVLVGIVVVVLVLAFLQFMTGVFR